MVESHIWYTPTVGNLLHVAGQKPNFIALWRAALFPAIFSVLVIPTEEDIKQQKEL